MKPSTPPSRRPRASASQPASDSGESLASGSSYLVLAYPHAVITPGAPGQHVEVDCTLSVPSGSGAPPPANPATTTKSLAVDLGSGMQSQAATITLVLPVASSTGSQTATVSCTEASTGASAPAVTVDTTISAIQTASNS